MVKTLICAPLLLATIIAPIATCITEAAELSDGPGTEAAKLPHMLESAAPDKSATVYATNYNNSAYLYLKGNNKKSDSHLITLHHGKVSKILWLSDNNTILYLGRPFPNDWVHLLSTNLKTRLSRDLTPFANKKVRAFYSGNKSDAVFVQMDIDETKPEAIYRIDTTSGAVTKTIQAQSILPPSAVYSPFEIPAIRQNRIDTLGSVVCTPPRHESAVKPLERQAHAKAYITLNYEVGRSVIERNGGETITSFPCFIERLQWLDDKETVVCLAKQFPRSPMHLFSININSAQTRDLTPFAGRSVRAFYYDQLQKDLVVQLNLKDLEAHDLHRIDPITGALRQVSKATQVLPIQTIYASKIDTQVARQLRYFECPPFAQSAGKRAHNSGLPALQWTARPRRPSPNIDNITL